MFVPACCSDVGQVLTKTLTVGRITSAYMVFHAEGLTGIELYCTAQLDCSASPRL